MSRKRDFERISTPTRWIRLKGHAGSPYPSLVRLEATENTFHSTKKEENVKYTVKIGGRIFQGRDTRTLLRLAVKSRRTAPLCPGPSTGLQPTSYIDSDAASESLETESVQPTDTQ